MRTQKQYQDAIRRMILKAGKIAFKAIEDGEGNCLTCGESGRCPGWHTNEGIEYQPIPEETNATKA